MRVLFDVLPILLVEFGQIFRPGGVVASVSMDHRSRDGGKRRTG